ncbi:hypothetical protein PYW07_009663 [Mythimna separata]|uniref:Plasminogen receptor (KT) n=1 Tax=Mythimna separata TaxID=271217 RepID=A0AAD7YBY5_MYTSE|nr:hypothetical protein PYW07_009663 [Mythimna separata]
MGNLIAGGVGEQMKKNQEMMQQMNKIKMERQIQFQYQMQKKQMAMQLAGSRDTCHWITAFYATIATGLITGFTKTRKPGLLIPLVPLAFPTAYFWDLAYGNKIRRIKTEADSILTNELDILEQVLGPPPSPIVLPTSAAQV